MRAVESRCALADKLAEDGGNLRVAVRVGVGLVVAHGFVHTIREETPNDPKLSDCGVRRGTCMVGGKAAAEAGAVTHGAVRCSAWLGVRLDSGETWNKSLERRGYRVNDPDAGVNDPDAGVNDPDAGVNDPDAGVNDPDARVNDPDARVNDPDAGVNDPDAGVNDPDAGVNDPDAGVNDPDERGAETPRLRASAESVVLDWLSFMGATRERLTTPSSATGAAGATAAWRGKGGGRKQRA